MKTPKRALKAAVESSVRFEATPRGVALKRRLALVAFVLRELRAHGAIQRELATHAGMRPAQLSRFLRGDEVRPVTVRRVLVGLSSLISS